MFALRAIALTPPSVNPVAGARPSHELGVGESLPRSHKANNIAPTLPRPAVGENATTQDYLRAVLAAGHTGQAQQALDTAETRVLDRSVAQGQTNTPSGSE